MLKGGSSWQVCGGVSSGRDNSALKVDLTLAADFRSCSATWHLKVVRHACLVLCLLFCETGTGPTRCHELVEHPSTVPMVADKA